MFEHYESDPGLAVVHLLFERMQIDSAWSTVQDRGFTWWPSQLAQRVWATPVYGREGTASSQVHIETDILRGVSEAAAVFDTLAALNHLATLSALVLQDGRVRLHASVLANAGNLPFAAMLATHAMALQVPDAYRVAQAAGAPLGGELDVSHHPTSGPRAHPDEMLDVGSVYADPSRPAPSIDFVRLAGSRERCWVEATADGTGFTAEIGLGAAPAGLGDGDETPVTALFQAATDQPHPGLGAGLLTTLTLPPIEPAGPAMANYLNVADTASPDSHALGAWSSDARRGLTYATFYPGIMFRADNAEYSYRLFESLVWHAAAHALRARALVGDAGRA